MHRFRACGIGTDVLRRRWEGIALAFPCRNPVNVTREQRAPRRWTTGNRIKSKEQKSRSWEQPIQSKHPPRQEEEKGWKGPNPPTEFLHPPIGCKYTNQDL